MLGDDHKESLLIWGLHSKRFRICTPCHPAFGRAPVVRWPWFGLLRARFVHEWFKRFQFSIWTVPMRKVSSVFSVWFNRKVQFLFRLSKNSPDSSGSFFAAPENWDVGQRGGVGGVSCHDQNRRNRQDHQGRLASCIFKHKHKEGKSLSRTAKLSRMLTLPKLNLPFPTSRRRGSNSSGLRLRSVSGPSSIVTAHSKQLGIAAFYG